MLIGFLPKLWAPREQEPHIPVALTPVHTEWRNEGLIGKHRWWEGVTAQHVNSTGIAYFIPSYEEGGRRKGHAQGLFILLLTCSVQFSSVTQSCPTLCNPMNCSTQGLPVHHQLSEFTQTQVHWVGDAIQPSHPLSSPSPPALNLSQHQGLFKWVSSSHQVAKVLEFQLQHQSFQWIPRTDLL